MRITFIDIFILYTLFIPANMNITMVSYVDIARILVDIIEEDYKLV